MTLLGGILACPATRTGYGAGDSCGDILLAAASVAMLKKLIKLIENEKRNFFNEQNVFYIEEDIDRTRKKLHKKLDNDLINFNLI